MLSTLCMYAALVLCVLQGSRNFFVDGQHFKRLRPLPTDKMPLPILTEDPDQQYDPTPSDIDDASLREQLGVDYLPDFMSPSQPRDFEAGDMVKPLSNRIPSEIRKLFKRQRNRKQRKTWKRIMKNKKFIMSWLYQETACPVRYRWKDLGVRFWPRFIKEGYCDSTKSCSIPAGMKCKSSAQSTIYILRWYCQGILEQKYCSWISIQYPVISECRCQC